jgi:hypothetical protein
VASSDASELVLPGRLQRLREELAEEAVPALTSAPDELAGLVELAYALRPPTHEGRVPAYGAVLVEKRLEGHALSLGSLDAELVDVGRLDAALVRRFADGLRAFAVRSSTGIEQLLCFGRAMAREYDLVLLRGLVGGIVLQRHTSGQVRIYGPAGVVRWDGITWHHDATVDRLLQRLDAIVDHIPTPDLRLLLLFAVHELSPRRIGATLVWRPTTDLPPRHTTEPRYPRVPAVSLGQPGGPATVASALGQIDGAALLGPRGELLAIGVQLIASAEATANIDPIGGTRHTSALRYSYDDQDAVVIVVSEAGPVTLMHTGTPRRLTGGTDETLIG